MQLHEVIEKEGMSKITSKTNISKDILNNIVNENFESLTRVKALGFLLILEREYKDIDVSGIRERVKLYFEEHKPLDENVVVISHDSQNSGFSFFKWFMILALIGGGWYFYSNGKLDTLLKNVKKEDFFDDKKALESNVTLEDAKKIAILNRDMQSVKADTLEAPIAKESIPLTNDEKVVELVIEEPKKETLTPKETIAEVEKAETIEEEAKPVEETKTPTVKILEEKVKVAVEKINVPTKTEEKSEVNLNPNDENIISDDTTLSDSFETITINPTRGMLWYGFINIDTKVKKEFMKKVSTPFELQSGRWLLVTGHGFVDIVSATSTVEVADSKKHYFYIDSTEIREISKAEFREMNGRHGW